MNQENGDDPCGDALDLIWRDVILSHRPHYGAWEYPRYAYRHIKAEFDDLRTENGRLRDALRKLANEARGFVSMADPATHGNTNINVLHHWIANAFAALASETQDQPVSENIPGSRLPWSDVRPIKSPESGE